MHLTKPHKQGCFSLYMVSTPLTSSIPAVNCHTQPPIGHSYTLMNGRFSILLCSIMIHFCTSLKLKLAWSRLYSQICIFSHSQNELLLWQQFRHKTISAKVSHLRFTKKYKNKVFTILQYCLHNMHITCLRHIAANISTCEVRSFEITCQLCCDRVEMKCDSKLRCTYHWLCKNSSTFQQQPYLLRAHFMNWLITWQVEMYEDSLEVNPSKVTYSKQSEVNCKVHDKIL